MLEKTELDFVKKHFTFWEHLTKEEQELLQQHITPLHFDKNDMIHSGGINCAGIILLKKGTIRAYLLSEEGREVTLFRLYEKDVCVLSASCLLSEITFDVQVNAEVDCDIFLIPSSIMSKLVENNVYVENFVYQITTSRFSDVMWAMQQILFLSFDKRLAIFLLDEMAKTKTTSLHLTHEQIARYTGSAREVVSRMLKYFAEEGVVSLSRGKIHIIDKEKLRSFV